MEGLLAALTDPTNPTAVATFSDYATARAGLVDGRYADSQESIRIVCGKETYKHCAGIFQTNSGVSALAMFAAESVGTYSRARRFRGGSKHSEGDCQP